MKHIKPYRIFESQESRHPGFPDTEEEIHRLCKKYKIKNFTINDDLTIYVHEGVNLSNLNLKYIPLNFNDVSGNFDCSENELTLLEGAPKKVGGYFYCYYNNLETLEGASKEVGGQFYCHSNNLTSLEGAPHIVAGNFDCTNNKLTSLKGSPHTVKGDFDCYNNELTSLDYIPSGIYYTNHYTRFDKNPIYTLIYTFIKNEQAEDLVREFNDYDIVRGDTVVLNRLKVFISDFDLKMPNLDEVKKYYEIV